MSHAKRCADKGVANEGGDPLKTPIDDGTRPIYAEKRANITKTKCISLNRYNDALWSILNCERYRNAVGFRFEHIIDGRDRIGVRCAPFCPCNRQFAILATRNLCAVLHPLVADGSDGLSLERFRPIFLGYRAALRRSYPLLRTVVAATVRPDAVNTSLLTMS